MGVWPRKVNSMNRIEIGTVFHRALFLIVMLWSCANWKALSSPSQYKVYTDGEREPKGSITSWSATNYGDIVVFCFHNKSSGSNWVVTLKVSDGHESQANSISEAEPKGSHNIFWDSQGTNGAYNPNIDVYLHNSVSGSNWVVSVARYKAIMLPYILRDVDSGIIYEVETDGRHVSATDSYGALLWCRDPFADAHLDYYRTNKPLIARFDFHKHGESENWDFPEEILHKKGIKNYISISFNSSQSGFMDVATGDFFPTGRL